MTYVGFMHMSKVGGGGIQVGESPATFYIVFKVNVALLDIFHNDHFHGIKEAVGFAVIFPDASYFLNCNGQVCQQPMSFKCGYSHVRNLSFESALYYIYFYSISCIRIIMSLMYFDGTPALTLYMIRNA
jgi:hypothetical protein